MEARKTTKELAEEAGIDLRDGTLGSMDDAIAAGDGTLHGAIDYWQDQCKKRNEALMLAKALLETLTTYDVLPSNIWKYFYASSTGDYVNLREVKEQAKPVLAAIDKVIGEK